jgi:type I restriction enzyme S subunit
MANTYTTYKDSGIPWIGEIPKEWNYQRLRFLCEINTGNQDTQNKEENGKYPFYVRSPHIERCNNYTFKGESILMAGDGAGAGRVFHHAFGKYAVHQRVYMLYNIHNINTSFLFYYISNLFADVMDAGSAQSTVPSVRLPMLSNFCVCIPTTKEQEYIVNFLDEKCSEIDDLISLQEKMIDELKEYKQSVITEVVTKGLDRNVKMKDSGIDWIGEIPEHWVTRQFKWLFSIKKDIAGELGYDVLSVTQKGIKIKDLSKNEGQIAQDYSKYQLVNPNDFVMNHMDLLTGYVDCSKYNGVTSPDYRVFHAINESSTSLAYYLRIFQTCYSCKIFYGLGQGVSGFGRWRLPAEQQKLFYLPYPPYAEQQEIATFLDTKCSEIDSLISIKEKKIEELKDYKKSLIYEYVTGKKRV